MLKDPSKRPEERVGSSGGSEESVPNMWKILANLGPGNRPKLREELEHTGARREKSDGPRLGWPTGTSIQGTLRTDIPCGA